jgi:hypothetical protein
MKVGHITVAGLTRQAHILRRRHTAALHQLAAGADSLAGFQRKRRVSKLRYHAARLVYLAAPGELASLGHRLESLPELRFYKEIFHAIDDNDVSRLVSFGTNAVQSAAQALRTTGGTVRCAPAHWNEVERAGLAILRLHGIPLDVRDSASWPNDEINRLALWDSRSQSLMQSSDPFIREVACLHGCLPAGRHASVLDTAFDIDEELAMDAINQVNVTS